LVQTLITKLLEVSSVELSKGEYALTMVMPTKDIFGNWIKHFICGDYRLMNMWMCFDKYAMPLLEKIFNAFGQAKFFSTLDLCLG
jgi:hypothetical protein